MSPHSFQCLRTLRDAYVLHYLIFNFVLPGRRSYPHLAEDKELDWVLSKKKIAIVNMQFGLSRSFIEGNRNQVGRAAWDAVVSKLVSLCFDHIDMNLSLYRLRESMEDQIEVLTQTVSQLNIDMVDKLSKKVDKITNKLKKFTVKGLFPSAELPPKLNHFVHNNTFRIHSNYMSTEIPNAALSALHVEAFPDSDFARKEDDAHAGEFLGDIMEKNERKQFLRVLRSAMTDDKWQECTNVSKAYKCGRPNSASIPDLAVLLQPPDRRRSLEIPAFMVEIVGSKKPRSRAKTMRDVYLAGMHILSFFEEAYVLEIFHKDIKLYKFERVSATCEIEVTYKHYQLLSKPASRFKKAVQSLFEDLTKVFLRLGTTLAPCAYLAANDLCQVQHFQDQSLVNKGENMLLHPLCFHVVKNAVSIYNKSRDEEHELLEEAAALVEDRMETQPYASSGDMFRVEAQKLLIATKERPALPKDGKVRGYLGPNVVPTEAGGTEIRPIVSSKRLKPADSDKSSSESDSDEYDDEVDDPSYSPRGIQRKKSGAISAMRSRRNRGRGVAGGPSGAGPSGAGMGRGAFLSQLKQQ